MNGVYMEMLPVKTPINVISQTMGNMGNISEVTPKTIRISWEVTCHWLSIRRAKCYLSQATYSRQKK